jgi:hypothetical protein
MKQSRMISKTFEIACLGFALAIFVQPVVAEDFTVIVPIVLKNLPADVIYGTLTVTAWAEDGSFVGNNVQFDTVLLVFHGFLFDIVGGNYSNTVTVKFNADPSRDPKQATKISAYIYLRRSGSASNNWQEPSQLLGTTGPYAQIDMNQPFNESAYVSLLNQ